jgi:hypothetical protein
MDEGRYNLGTILHGTKIEITTLAYKWKKIQDLSNECTISTAIMYWDAENFFLLDHNNTNLRAGLRCVQIARIVLVAKESTWQYTSILSVPSQKALNKH